MNYLSKNLQRLLHPSFQGSSALTSKQQFASYDKRYKTVLKWNNIPVDLPLLFSPDIVVAGGGLIGTAAALAISKSKALSHLNVLLLENTKVIKIVILRIFFFIIMYFRRLFQRPQPKNPNIILG